MSRGGPDLRLAAAVALAAVVALGASAGAPGSGGVVARVTASPLSLTLRLHQDEVEVGKRVKATATLTNVGSVSLRSATLTLRGDPSGLAIDGPQPHSLEKLKPGKSRSVHWHVCGKTVGSYVLVARATARTDAGTIFVVESDAQLLTVLAARHRSECHDEDEDDDDDDD